jgi:hypothetical protein
MARLFRLLALIAVLLMPIGMSPAAAASHRAPTAGMPMQHCPEQNPNRHAKAAFVDCTMACSAALPAADLLRAEPVIIRNAPVERLFARALIGIQPEIATPPPRRS